MARPRAMNIRKGDVVQMIAGKDKGKKGVVLEADPVKRRVIVENLNMAKKHRRPRPLKDSSRMGQQQIQPGGVFDIAAAVDVSNVMVVCPACDRPTRIGSDTREVKGRQVKVRRCRRADCGEVLDR